VKVLLSWIRDFVDVPGTPDEIGERMSLRGLALEGIERLDDDAVLDFEVNANRPDCLSIRGVAREIATAYQLPLKEIGPPDQPPLKLRRSAEASAKAEGGHYGESFARSSTGPSRF
jgi:phenylalanyl-tRNA synthetase beta subunit